MAKYDHRHGGAYDRGSADSYYGRPKNPHYYIGPTSPGAQMVSENKMTPSEIIAYNAGYDDNERSGDKKNWN